MNCPKCGSTNIQAVNQQIVKGKVTDTRKTKGFGWCKACIGTCLTGGIGFFCGLCRKSKKKGLPTVVLTAVINSSNAQYLVLYAASVGQIHESRSCYWLSSIT